MSRAISCNFHVPTSSIQTPIQYFHHTPSLINSWTTHSLKRKYLPLLNAFPKSDKTIILYGRRNRQLWSIFSVRYTWSSSKLRIRRHWAPAPLAGSRHLLVSELCGLESYRWSVMWLSPLSEKRTAPCPNYSLNKALVSKPKRRGNWECGKSQPVERRMGISQEVGMLKTIVRQTCMPPFSTLSVITFCGTAFFTSCLDLLLSYFPHSLHLDGRFLTKEPNIHKGDWVICPITKNKNKINDAGKTGGFDAEGWI